MLAQQLLLNGSCQWVQIIALNLNFPLKFLRLISSLWIKHEKESEKIGRANSFYSWSRDSLSRDLKEGVSLAKLDHVNSSYKSPNLFKLPHQGRVDVKVIRIRHFARLLRLHDGQLQTLGHRLAILKIRQDIFRSVHCFKTLIKIVLTNWCSWLQRSIASILYNLLMTSTLGLLEAVWPVKNLKMSIKVAHKWFP